MNSRVAEARRRYRVRIDCDYDPRLKTWVYRYVPEGALPEPSGPPVAQAAAPDPPSPLGSENAQLSLVPDPVADVLTVAAQPASRDWLDHATQEYAERLAERLRRDQPHRRLRVVS